MQQINKIYETNIQNELRYDIIKMFEDQQNGKFYMEHKKNTEFVIPNTNNKQNKWYVINNNLKINIYDKLKKYILENVYSNLGLTLNNFVISKNNKTSLIDNNLINLIDKKRVLTFILFLNNGGNIHLLNNKIKSEKGKLIIFPSDLEYNIEIKDESFTYFITGYLYNSY